MRIVVIGGSGYLGSRAVSALRSAKDVEVLVAGRSGRDLAVDLARPKTFVALDGADVIVNASSTHAVAPDALAAHCLEHGLVMLEASSDRIAIERLLDAHRGRDAKGALVLGAGIFTGVSNALAAEAVRALPGADEVSIGVSSSPFSGAGAGTIDLMADAMSVPTRTIRGGARVEDPPISPGPELPFLHGARKTIHAPFAEVVMVHASTKVPEVAMYMAPKPAPLRGSFLMLPAMLIRSRFFGAFLRIYFRIVRRLFFRSVVSAVELVARARERASGREHLVQVSVADGMTAGGVAIAATAIAIARRAERPRGTFLVDELVPLGAMIEGMRELSPGTSIEIAGA